MSVDTLIKRIKDNKPDGVYVMCGDEEYTKSFYLKKLISFAEKNPAPEFNTLYFQGDSLSADALSDALDTPPFMSDHKSVVVRDLDFGNKDLTAKLLGMLDGVPDGVILIFVFGAGVIDYGAYLKKKDKLQYAQFLDAVSSVGICADFQKESGKKLYSWIAKHFASRKTAVDSEAVEFLPEYCGNDMSLLIGEIEKLCSYCRGRSVTKADIINICCPNAEYQTFDLADAIVEHNAARTRAVFGNLRFTKTPPELILGTVAKNFCDMLFIKTAFSEGRDQSMVMNALGIPDWIYRRLFASAKRISPENLRLAVSECAKTDTKLKTFSGEPYDMLELLFCSIYDHGKA